MSAAARAAQSAKLNDEHRAALTGLTSGISALGSDAVTKSLFTVATFTVDNDPHSENDFGAFTNDGNDGFWKIDYYAPDMSLLFIGLKLTNHIDWSWFWGAFTYSDSFYGVSVYRNLLGTFCWSDSWSVV